MLICNVDPDFGYIAQHSGLKWSAMELVKDTFYMNLILGTTIGLGWISFLLDIIFTWLKSRDWRSGPLSILDWFLDPLDKEAGFWDRAVLLEGLQVNRK